MISHRFFNGMPLLLLILVLGILLPAAADIKSVTCTFGNPTDLGKKYNSGQAVSIRSTWTGDTPPFAATFKANSIPIGTVNTVSGQADFSTSAGSLVEGSNNFSVTVLETAVPNPTPSPDTAAAGTLQVDRTAPSMTVNVLSGAVVSPQTGFNEVVISVTASEDLGEAPQFTISPGTWGPPTPVSPEAPPYSSNQYRIQVPANTPAGAYTIRVTGRDNTEPAASRNTGTGQTAFQVDSAADGSPTILSCTPKSPMRTESVTLTGSIPRESQAQKLDVFEGTASAGSVIVPADTDTWSVTVAPLTEGTHTYTARRTDPLGNVSPNSPDFTLVADRTPPHEPQLDSPKSPVNTSKVRITGQSVTDPPHNSGPLKVTLYSGSQAIASAVANADGRFTFEDVPLNSGQNALAARSSDTTWDGSGSSGNSSAYSNMITIVLDQQPPVIVSGGVVIGRAGDSPPTVVMRQAEVPVAVQAPPPVVADKPGPPKTGSAPEKALSLAPQKSPDHSVAFLPPMGDWSARLVPIALPLAVVRDRSPQRVRVWAAFRKWGQTRGTMNLIPLPLTGSGFSGFLPNAPEPLFYRFRLVDGAGNESFFPASGELYKPNQRCDTLRLVLRPRWYEEAPAEDEWPVEALGMPPAERLLGYRRLLVHPTLRPQIEALLADQKASAGIEILDIEAGDGPAPWRRDLDLLEAGRLPVERLDLLVPEVVNGVVPLNRLPAADRLPPGQEFDGLRDAIRFRHLHEPSP